MKSLQPIFAPRAVAVIGASNRAGAVGHTLLWNLISNPFGGTVYPVHPRAASVLGVKAYPRVGEIPDSVDLAVIAIPAHSVPKVVGECSRAGVRGAVIVSAGFRETGVAGRALEGEIMDHARAGGMRVLGPNCLGVMLPHSGLNATFARVMARPGNVGFISQSGALCVAVLDWSIPQDVGFSAVLSVGSMLDIGWADLIRYLCAEPHTRSIVLYMESIGDARSFMSAARSAALSKPVIVLKSGRTAAAARAAHTHSGLRSGDDDVLDAAFRRCGVLRVNLIEELFSMAEVLGCQPRPRGPRLAVLTNAGGPGVLASDALAHGGGRLAEPAPATVDALNQLLPAEWSHADPVDLLSDADPERYLGAATVLLDDPGCDGLLAILTPQASTDSTRTAELIVPSTRVTGKPVLASWMGGAEVASGTAVLSRAGIPTFHYPDMAARVFNYMWRYSDNLRALYETPGEAGSEATDAGAVVALRTELARRRATGSLEVGPQLRNKILAAFAIAPPTAPAGAERGVTMGDKTIALALRAAPDAQIGPVLYIESAGPEAGGFPNSGVGLPPLNTTLARRMIEPLRCYPALVEHGRAGALSELTSLLVRFSQILVTIPELRSAALGPILVGPYGLRMHAADFTLYPPEIDERDLPSPAIRPYPMQFVWHRRIGDVSIRARPIRPEDEPLIARFHAGLSDRSVYQRYFHPVNPSHLVSHEELLRICFVDYDEEMVLVAECIPSDSSPKSIIAVARLMRLFDRGTAEFAITVADDYQSRGLGTWLLERLIAVANAEGIARIVADILPENHPMQRACERLGFTIALDPEESMVRAEICLPPRPGAHP